MDIRMIAIDLDGTLLTTAQTVSEEDRLAIAEATRQGIEIVLSTGRAIGESREVLKQLPKLHYACCCTGAYLADLWENRPIKKHSMQAEDGRKLFAVLRNYDCHVSFFADGVVHNDQTQMDNFTHFYPIKMRGLFDASHIYEESLADFVRDFRGEVDKLYIAFASRAERERAFSEVSRLPYYVTGAGFVDFEIMAQGVDKATGIRDLAEYLQIDRAQIAAIGDSENDLPALRYSGLPIAMGNASDAVKAAAKRIAPDHDHSGVAWAIRRILEENSQLP